MGSRRVVGDAEARACARALRAVACRVVTEAPPAVTPPMDGMVTLGGRDRASWVWFLPNGSNGGPTNNGLGVDREHLGYWTIRAWRHSGGPVSNVRLHVAEPTAELIEQAARLIGLPLHEAGGACRACALVGLLPCYLGGCAAPEKDEVGT